MTDQTENTAHVASVVRNTAEAVRSFAESVGLTPLEDGIETVGGDLVAELLHLVHYNGDEPAERVLARAITFYLSEQNAAENGENPRDGGGKVRDYEVADFLDAVLDEATSMCDPT